MELMAQGEDFRLQGGSRPDRCTEGVKKRDDNRGHRQAAYSCIAVTSIVTTRTDFSVGQGPPHWNAIRSSSSIRMLPPDAGPPDSAAVRAVSANASRETSTTCAWHCCHCPVLDAGLDRRLSRTPPSLADVDLCPTRQDDRRRARRAARRGWWPGTDVPCRARGDCGVDRSRCGRSAEAPA